MVLAYRLELLVMQKHRINEPGARGHEDIAFKSAEGVCWKPDEDGGYVPTPCCPRCKLFMKPYPPEKEDADFLMCPQCNIMAPFAAKSIPDIIDRLSS